MSQINRNSMLARVTEIIRPATRRRAGAAGASGHPSPSLDGPSLPSAAACLHSSESNAAPAAAAAADIAAGDASAPPHPPGIPDEGGYRARSVLKGKPSAVIKRFVTDNNIDMLVIPVTAQPVLRRMDKESKRGVALATWSPPPAAPWTGRPLGPTPHGRPGRMTGHMHACRPAADQELCVSQGAVHVPVCACGEAPRRPWAAGRVVGPAAVRGRLRRRPRRALRPPPPRAVVADARHRLAHAPHVRLAPPLPLPPPQFFRSSPQLTVTPRAQCTELPWRMDACTCAACMCDPDTSAAGNVQRANLCQKPARHSHNYSACHAHQGKWRSASRGRSGPLVAPCTCHAEVSTCPRCMRSLGSMAKACCREPYMHPDQHLPSVAHAPSSPPAPPASPPIEQPPPPATNTSPPPGTHTSPPPGQPVSLRDYLPNSSSLPPSLPGASGLPGSSGPLRPRRISAGSLSPCPGMPAATAGAGGSGSGAAAPTAVSAGGGNSAERSPGGDDGGSGTSGGIFSTLRSRVGKLPFRKDHRETPAQVRGILASPEHPTFLHQGRKLITAYFTEADGVALWALRLEPSGRLCMQATQQALPPTDPELMSLDETLADLLSVLQEGGLSGEVRARGAEAVRHARAAIASLSAESSGLRARLEEEQERRGAAVAALMGASGENGGRDVLGGSSGGLGGNGRTLMRSQSERRGSHSTVGGGSGGSIGSGGRGGIEHAAVSPVKRDVSP